MTSSDSRCSFSGKHDKNNNQLNLSNFDQELNRKCMKSPTFDASLAKAVKLSTPQQISETFETSGKCTSPKTKRDIIRLFCVPKSAKKKKLQIFFNVKPFD